KALALHFFGECNLLVLHRRAGNAKLLELLLLRTLAFRLELLGELAERVSDVRPSTLEILRLGLAERVTRHHFEVGPNVSTDARDGAERVLFGDHALAELPKCVLGKDGML